MVGPDSSPCRSDDGVGILIAGPQDAGFPSVLYIRSAMNEVADARSRIAAFAWDRVVIPGYLLVLVAVGNSRERSAPA